MPRTRKRSSKCSHSASASSSDTVTVHHVPSTFLEQIVTEFFRWFSYVRGSAIARNYSPDIAFSAASVGLLALYILESGYEASDKSKKSADPNSRQAKINALHATALQHLHSFIVSIFSVVMAAYAESKLQQVPSSSVMGIFGIPLEVILIAMAIPILLKYASQVNK